MQFYWEKLQYRPYMHFRAQKAMEQKDFLPRSWIPEMAKGWWSAGNLNRNSIKIWRILRFPPFPCTFVSYYPGFAYNNNKMYSRSPIQPCCHAPICVQQLSGTFYTRLYRVATAYFANFKYTLLFEHPVHGSPAIFLDVSSRGRAAALPKTVAAALLSDFHFHIKSNCFLICKYITM